MKFIMLCCLCSLLSACSNIRKEDLGLARVSPNEKVVEQRQPLVIPNRIVKQ